MSINKRALSINQDCSAVEGAPVFFDDADREINMTFFSGGTQVFELRRRNSDSGFVVFGVPFSTCESMKSFSDSCIVPNEDSTGGNVPRGSLAPIVASNA